MPSCNLHFSSPYSFHKRVDQKWNLTVKLGMYINLCNNVIFFHNIPYTVQILFTFLTSDTF